MNSCPTYTGGRGLPQVRPPGDELLHHAAALRRRRLHGVLRVFEQGLRAQVLGQQLIREGKDLVYIQKQSKAQQRRHASIYQFFVFFQEGSAALVCFGTRSNPYSSFTRHWSAAAASASFAAVCDFGPDESITTAAPAARAALDIWLRMRCSAASAAVSLEWQYSC